MFPPLRRATAGSIAGVRNPAPRATATAARTLGHNHVVVGRVHGEIRGGDTAAASGFRLEIPVDSFGGGSARSARRGRRRIVRHRSRRPARRDTRENMLGRDVLDAGSIRSFRIESNRARRSAMGSDGHGTRHAPWSDARSALRRGRAAAGRHARQSVAAFPHQTQSEFSIEPFTASQRGLCGFAMRSISASVSSRGANYVLLHFRCNAPAACRNHGQTRQAYRSRTL